MYNFNGGNPNNSSCTGSSRHVNSGHGNINNSIANGNIEDPSDNGDGDRNKNDEDKPDHLDPSSPKFSKDQKRKRNDRFSGQVTLYIGDTLKQELTILFGVRIRPSVSCAFADCQIVLDPVTVTASTVFTDNEDTTLDALLINYFYITQDVRIIIALSQGMCDVPTFIHPLRRHFAERRIVSTKNQFDVSFEASVYPKFIVKDSKGKGKTVKYNPVTLALEPGYIGPAARNGYQWEYKPVRPIGTNIEMLSRNPPVYEAIYRVYNAANTPEFIKVAMQATFRQNGKISRQKIPNVSAARRVLRDINAIYIIIRLEAKIGKTENNWFLFPADKKEGSRL